LAWFDERPERLDFELRALDAACFPYEIDGARKAAGQLILAVRCRVEGVEYPLTVVFPNNYPFFPFQVLAPTLNLKYHQDRHSKALCFVARIDSEWETTDTLAEYLLDRFPKVLKASEGDGGVAEAREGAPATGYMIFQPGTVVLTADWLLPKGLDRGALVIGIEGGTDPSALLRGAVLEVRSLDGILLGEADAHFKTRYVRHLNARWVRLPATPLSTEAWPMLREAEAVWPALKTPTFNGGPDVVGIVFQDEARFREMHDLWVFVVRRRDRDVAVRGTGKRLPPGDQISACLARPDRSGRADIQTRVPRLKPISAKKAAIFGLGALGSMVAWQFARAGIGRLSVIDDDFVQAGNMPRWIMGLPAAGHQKVLVFASMIALNFPFTEVLPLNFKLGAAIPPDLDVPRDIDDQLVSRAIEDADILIDCTVELTAHHYLSDLSWRRGLPYIWCSGTTGGWGGIVGRALRGKTSGCWRCFRHHRVDGTYPSPAEEEVADVQPIGCFSPTFTGSGFDLDLVSLTAVRLAASTLCIGSVDGYQDFNWDVGVVDLWDNGAPIAPKWKTFSLERHPACDAHG